MDLENKALDYDLTLKRKRIMIYFIEATEKLLRRDGIENLTIRGIATEAGYNSATIYNYFNDLDQLIMFGSLCYLRDYVAELEAKLKPDMRAIEQYRTVYHCFNKHALDDPEIYHHIFFGKYRDQLPSVLDLYYHVLFPNELDHLSKEMQNMLVQCADVSPDLTTYEKNRDTLYTALTQYGFECVKPDGAFYLFLRAPKGDSAAQFCEKAKKHEIMLVPSDSFGIPGYARLAYCASEKTVNNSLPAFKKLAEEYGL